MENESLHTLLILIAPLFFLITSFMSGFWPGSKPVPVLKSAAVAAGLSITASIYGIIQVFLFGFMEGGLVLPGGLGLTLRLDPLSMLMFTMIALLGFIVIKFSRNYLDGDRRHGIFTGRLAATIAAVQILVLSGNLLIIFLAWVATSLMLHRLLVFYPERRRAVVAARKKFIVARLGDLFLLGAFILIYFQYATGNLQVIFDAVKAAGSIPPNVELAAVFLVFAALLKSAQFPTQGWLIEVVDTPTPVSALLHAGLLNAGPFLIIRMAFLIDAVEMAPIVLIIMGGLTALIASVSYLTQPSVKTALAYSSSAHMGFLLLISGIGVYPAAMLHLVAHSFYKAHAFLASGSAIETTRASKTAPPKRIGNPFRIMAGILIAFAVYMGFSILWGINPSDEFSLLATGAMVVMGLAQIISPALDSDGYLVTTLRTVLLTLLVAAAFFTLETGSHYLLYSQLPELSKPNELTIALTILTLVVFGAAVLAQLAGPVIRHHVIWQKLGVHFRNGFYVNAFFDRITGAFSMQNPMNKKQTEI